MNILIFKNITIGLLLIVLVMSCNCVKLGLRLSPSLFSNIETSFFEECDPVFASNSFPSSLKLLEGLLKSDPENSDILNSLCKGFYGYSMLFVEGPDPGRASELYIRARDYGLRALKKKGSELLKATQKDTAAILADINRDEFETLLWTTVAWSSWINLNIDKPTALAQLGKTQTCLDFILSYDPEYMYGLPYILKGVTLSAMPPMLGGDPKNSKDYFDMALRLNGGDFFLTQYYYARYYAVRVQNRELFDSLIDEIVLNIDTPVLKDVCLLNSAVITKAIELREMDDELFF